MDVIRGTDLERKVWVFRLAEHGMTIRLESYHEQTRASKRHKFQGSSWSYINGTAHFGLGMPTEIPQDVLAEAIAEMVRLAASPKVYIGYLSQEYRYTPTERKE